MRNTIFITKISFFIFIALLWACGDNKEIKNIKKRIIYPLSLNTTFLIRSKER